MVNVYVETNYLLNIARKQEESIYSSKILRAAKNKKITLKLPVYCIAESYSALQKRHESFKSLRNEAENVLNDLVRSLNRSKLHKSAYEIYKNLPVAIQGIIQNEITQLDKAIINILKSAEVLICSRKVHYRGIIFRTALKIPHEMDAAIIASIVEDIKTDKFTNKVFITTDKNLLTVELRKLLQQQKCIHFSSFKKAYKFIENKADR